MLSRPNQKLDAVLDGIRLSSDKISDGILNKLSQLGKKLDAVLLGINVLTNESKLLRKENAFIKKQMTIIKDSIDKLKV